MKKIFTLLFFTCLIIFNTKAQKVNFGIRLGVTNAGFNEKLSGQGNVNTDALTNIDPRISLNIDLGHFSIQPGLAYYLKGASNGISITSSNIYNVPALAPGATFTSSTLLKIKYLELPVNILYNIKLPVGRIFVGAGPYLAMALSANSEVYSAITTSSSISQNTVKTSISLGSDITQVKQMDYGVNGLGGFRFNNGIELALGVGFGLTNISNLSYITAKNHTASVTLGYFFK